MFRKTLALISCGTLLVLPALSASDPVGHVAAAQGALISGVQAPAGTTVFNGDSIAVPASGTATLDLSDGSVLEMSGGTAVRVAKSGSRIDVQLDRGGIRLSSSGRAPSAGRVADLVFRPAEPAAGSIGLIKLTGRTRVSLLAEKGDWLAYTSENGRTVLLHHGEELRGVISGEPAQGTETGQEKKKKKKRKLGVIWIGTALAGTATGLGMAFGMSECNVNYGPCPSNSVVSPVAP